MTDKTYHQIGQRPHEVTLAVRGDRPLDRTRLPFTRRHLLKWQSRLNPKTLAQERILADKKPLWWFLGLGLLALSAPFLSNQALTIVSVFCIFSAINVLWTLIIGTAGIFSLATLAVVGAGAYVAAAMNVYLGLPWPFMFVVGGLGRAEGAVIGTAIVVLIDKGMLELGPLRILLVAGIMLLVTLWTNNGIAGAPYRKGRRCHARRSHRKPRQAGQLLPPV